MAEKKEVSVEVNIGEDLALQVFSLALEELIKDDLVGVKLIGFKRQNSVAVAVFTPDLMVVVGLIKNPKQPEQMALFMFEEYKIGSALFISADAPLGLGKVVEVEQSRGLIPEEDLPQAQAVFAAIQALEPIPAKNESGMTVQEMIDEIFFRR